MSRIEAQFEETGLHRTPLEFPQLRDARGRQDFFHFWFYSALAVPGIWLTGMSPATRTTHSPRLNVALLLAAVRLVSTRLTWWFTAAVFCSPVLWWATRATPRSSRSRCSPWPSPSAGRALVVDDLPGRRGTQKPANRGAPRRGGRCGTDPRRGAWRDVLSGPAHASPPQSRCFIRSTTDGGGASDPATSPGHACPDTHAAGIRSGALGSQRRVLFHAPLLVLTFLAAAIAVGIRAGPARSTQRSGSPRLEPGSSFWPSPDDQLQTTRNPWHEQVRRLAGSA